MMAQNQKKFKEIIISLLYVIVPLILGTILSLWLKLSIYIPTATIYAIVLLFLVPADNFFHSSVDYKAKSINPTYRPPTSKIDGGTKRELLHFILVVISLIFCLVGWYLSSL
ncbi:hypothetical protein IGJ55_003125 [Enterococcus sp. AZ170]